MLHRPSDISSGANEASTNGFHVTRITNHGFFVSLFTIVHHCSLLFGIVQQKIVLRHCPRAARSLLSCALSSGMGRLWRGMGGSRPPHRQQGRKGFSKHETRNTRHGFFQTRITAFPEAWPLRSFDSPWVRKGRTTGNRRPDHRACRLACMSHHAARRSA